MVVQPVSRPSYRLSGCSPSNQQEAEASANQTVSEVSGGDGPSSVPTGSPSFILGGLAVWPLALDTYQLVSPSLQGRKLPDLYSPAKSAGCQTNDLR
jgi:hypothetical protein